MERASQTKTKSLWLGILVSVISLLAILYFVDLSATLRTLRTVPVSAVTACLLGILLFLALRAIRWRYLLQGDVSLGRVFHIQNIGYMLTMLLPLRLGDLGRIVLIGRQPRVNLMRATSTLLIERLFDLLFFVTLLPFTLANIDILPPELRIGARVAGFIALAGVASLITAANRQHIVLRLASWLLHWLPFLDTAAWLRRTQQLLNGLHSLRHWHTAAILTLWSILIWLPVIATYYIMMQAVGLNITLAAAAFTTCVAAFGVAAPSSPGQFGIFHGAVLLALVTVLGRPINLAFSFALLFHTLQFLTFIFMGLIGLAATGQTFSGVIRAAQRNTEQ